MEQRFAINFRHSIYNVIISLSTKTPLKSFESYF